MKGSQGRVEMEQNRKERERKRSKKYTPCSFHISMLVFLLFIIINYTTDQNKAEWIAWWKVKMNVLYNNKMCGIINLR